MIRLIMILIAFSFSAEAQQIEYGGNIEIVPVQECVDAEKKGMIGRIIEDDRKTQTYIVLPPYVYTLTLNTVSGFVRCIKDNPR